MGLLFEGFCHYMTWVAALHGVPACVLERMVTFGIGRLVLVNHDLFASSLPVTAVTSWRANWPNSQRVICFQLS